jgi:hypothetical protein
MTRLTDDEAVAIATLTGATWPTVLPTIDLSTPRARDAAVARGIRSLGVRGLTGVNAAGEPVLTDRTAQLLSDAVGHPSRVAAYVGSSIAPYPVLGTTVVASSAAGSSTAVFDVVTAAGVHDVVEVSCDAAADAVVEFARKAFTDGIPAPDGVEPSAEFVLYVGSLSDSGSTVSRVHQGRVTRGMYVVREDGDLEFRADAEATDWPAAQNLLGLSLG